MKINIKSCNPKYISDIKIGTLFHLANGTNTVFMKTECEDIRINAIMVNNSSVGYLCGILLDQEITVLKQKTELDLEEV